MLKLMAHEWTNIFNKYLLCDKKGLFLGRILIEFTNGKANPIYKMFSEKSSFIHRNYYYHVQLIVKEFNKHYHFVINGCCLN